MIQREVMVFCSCKYAYIATLPDAQGNRPIPDIAADVAVHCPKCGADIRDYSALAGHSGGTFNCWSSRATPVREGK